jgi:hypothetical protein
VPLVILAVCAWLAWVQIWHETDLEVSRAASGAAEYAGRLLEGNSLLVDRADDLLRPLSDEQIGERESELHDALQKMAAQRPEILTFYAINAAGRPMVSANLFPVMHGSKSA